MVYGRHLHLGCMEGCASSLGASACKPTLGAEREGGREEGGREGGKESESESESESEREAATSSIAD